MERRRFLKESTSLALGIGFTPLSSLLSLPGCSVDARKSELETLPHSITPSQPEYQNLSKVHNQRFHHIVPAGFVQPENIETLREQILWSRSHTEIPLHIRSGGHCFEDFSSGPGLLLDLQKMKSILVDASGKKVQVGAGVLIGELINALAAHNLCLPLGTCPAVGISGLTLGGGYGFLSRSFGLTCDALESLTVLTANGAVVRASATENQDLFWACRGGGGGQFGIATSFTFRVFDVPNITTVSATWTPAPTQQHDLVLRHWQSQLPRWTRRTTGVLYMEASIQILMGWHLGTKQEAERAFRPLLHGAHWNQAQLQEEPYVEANARFGGRMTAEPAFANFKSKSLYFQNPLPSETLSQLGRLLKHSTGVGLIFDPYGGAIGDIAPDATAFYHRQALFCLQLRCDWPRGTSGREALASLQEIYQLLEPLSSGSYVNYCDSELQDWARRYWGRNVTRLSQIKRIYDPENRFRHRQSL